MGTSQTASKPADEAATIALLKNLMFEKEWKIFEVFHFDPAAFLRAFYSDLNAKRVIHDMDAYYSPVFKNHAPPTNERELRQKAQETGYVPSHPDICLWMAEAKAKGDAEAKAKAEAEAKAIPSLSETQFLLWLELRRRVAHRMKKVD